MTWDDLFGRAPSDADPQHPVGTRARPISPTSGCPMARAASRRADGPWRLLAEGDRRPHDDELGGGRPAQARPRRLEHRVSRRRRSRRRLSRHLPRCRSRGRRPARAGRRPTISTSAASPPSGTPPAATSRSGWPAAHALPAGSPMRMDNPLKLVGVVNSGGLADLAELARGDRPQLPRRHLRHACRRRSVRRAPNVLSDTSPAELLPLHVRQVSVNGHRDRIAPPVLGESMGAQGEGGRRQRRSGGRAGHRPRRTRRARLRRPGRSKSRR